MQLNDFMNFSRGNHTLSRGNSDTHIRRPNPNVFVDMDFSNIDDFSTCRNAKQSMAKYIEQETSKFNERKQSRIANENASQRQLTQKEIIELSLNEEKMTNEIRTFISNKKLLTEALSELKDVNPNDPIFDQFY